MDVPQTEPQLEELLDLRTVTIMWIGDDEYPSVEYEGCSSIYEAESMTRHAAAYLSRLARIPSPSDEDDDRE